MIAYALFVVAWHAGAFLVGGWRGVVAALLLDLFVLLPLLAAWFVIEEAVEAARERRSLARIRRRVMETIPKLPQVPWEDDWDDG